MRYINFPIKVISNKKENHYFSYLMLTRYPEASFIFSDKLGFYRHMNYFLSELSKNIKNSPNSEILPYLAWNLCETYRNHFKNNYIVNRMSAVYFLIFYKKDLLFKKSYHIYYEYIKTNFPTFYSHINDILEK